MMMEFIIFYSLVFLVFGIFTILDIKYNVDCHGDLFIAAVAAFCLSISLFLSTEGMSFYEVLRQVAGMV